VAALTPLDVIPWGVYDVRDKLKELLATVCKYEETPPCLTHEALVLFNKEEKIWKSDRDVYIGVETTSEFEKLARMVYEFLIIDLVAFYCCSSIAHDIEKSVLNSHKLESLLLKDLKKFLQTNWHEIRKKRAILSHSKKRIVEILDGLSRYSHDMQELDTSLKHLDERRTHNPRLNELITKITKTDVYAKPRKYLDVVSTMRIIEHTRLELETYITNTSTMVAALAGAIIGSLLTLVATYFLGVINTSTVLNGNSTVQALLILV
jgi:hypothetical protein